MRTRTFLLFFKTIFSIFFKFTCSTLFLVNNLSAKLTKDLFVSYPIPLIFLFSQAFKNKPVPDPISKTSNFLFFNDEIKKFTLGS